ncbi:MAG: hypothetical protein KF819_26080 [Labilithrix sp.]|nr:hypothetical protein [Labilithrix sp.]
MVAVATACSPPGGDPGADDAGMDGGPALDGEVEPDALSPDGEPPADGGADATSDATTDGPGDASLEADVDAEPLVCDTPAWDGPYDLPDGVCSIDGFCQLSMTPVHDLLDRVWTAAPNDVWMTGRGITVHWDGIEWRGLTGSPTKLGGAIAGTGPNNVWIGPLHWDGVTLAKSPKPQPGISTWFASADDGWSVDGTTTAYHWDGVDWTPVATGAVLGLKAVHGFSSNDVWAVGGTSVRHWNGAAWVDPPMPLPAGETADVIGGAAPDDFWVAGTKLFHYVGGVWSEHLPAVSGAKAITGISTDSVVFVTSARLWRWNGASIVGDIAAGNAPCSSCACQSAATAPDGSRFIATRQSDMPIASLLGCPAWKRTYAPNDLVSISPATASLPAITRVVHWNGTLMGLAGTSICAGADCTQKPLWGVTAADSAVGLSASSADDVWVSGFYDAATNIASHWDGAAWSYALLPGKPTSAVGAASPTSAWVITGASTAYWNGLTWVDRGAHGITSPAAIWGANADDAWVVGNGIAHWNGVSWATVPGAPTNLVDVRGSSANDVVAVRRDASVHRWNGVTWSIAPGSTRTGTFRRFYIVSPSDIWAALVTSPNTDPRVLHWDGSCWRPVSTGWNVDAVEAVGGSSAEIFAVSYYQSQRLVR